MRYAKAPPVVFRYLRELQRVLVVEFVAEHLGLRRSFVAGSRDEGQRHVRLHARTVVFSSSLSVISRFSQAPTALVLDETSLLSFVNAAIATARTVVRLS